MENGFNDDELADIMNEIESLEKEFTEEADSSDEKESEAQAEEHHEPVVAEEHHEPVVTEEHHEPVVAEEHHEPVVAEEHHEPEVVEEHHEPVVAQEVSVIEKVSELPVEDTVKFEQDFEDENIHKMHQRANSSEAGKTAMNFNVEGNMKLDLAFNISGKSVRLNITEEGFELTLDNGIKFSIPLDDSTSSKKAA
jgi:hypothetical protein